LNELKSLIDKVKGKSGNFIEMDVFQKMHHGFGRLRSMPAVVSMLVSWTSLMVMATAGVRAAALLFGFVRGNTIDKTSR